MKVQIQEDPIESEELSLALGRNEEVFDDIVTVEISSRRTTVHTRDYAYTLRNDGTWTSARTISV